MEACQAMMGRKHSWAHKPKRTIGRGTSSKDSAEIRSALLLFADDNEGANWFLRIPEGIMGKEQIDCDKRAGSF